MTYREGMERIFGQTIEMQKACELLYKLKAYSPVIAGGALWSWANGRRPNDIDIFVGDFHGSVRSAFAAAFEPNTGGSDTLAEMPRRADYQNIDGGRQYEIYRFKHKLEVGDQTVGAGGYVIPVDLVVTPWRSSGPIWYFDYNHCRVAFGEDVRNDTGADAYGKGLLQTTHEHPRPEERVRSKLQKELWGNPDAGTRLRMVLEQLDGIYKRLVTPMTPEEQKASMQNGQVRR